VFHAPQGLGGPEPHDARRLRSIAVFLTTFGLATLAGLWLVESVRSCPDDDPDAACQNSSGHSSGGHSSARHGGSGSVHGATSFGGFGATGEGGAHGGGPGGGGGE
jgi:hypothetical protein